MFNVHAENFLSFADVEFDFSNRGLCLIQGQNLDKPLYKSNGSGKSSLVDALCWGLYGVSIKGKTDDDVINNVAKKNCCVTVTWGDGNKVVRYRKHTKMKDTVMFWENGSEVTAKSNKDTQALIDKALGLGYEAFIHSIYFRQSTLEGFASGTDAEQKKIIEEILSLHLLTDAQKICKDKVAAIQKEIDVLQSKAANFNIKLQEAKSRVGMLTARSKEFEGRKEQAVMLAEKAIRDLEAQRSQAPSDFNIDTAKELVRKAEPMVETNAKLEKELWQLQSDMQKHQQAYSNAESRKAQALMQLQMNRERAEELLNEVRGLESVTPESRTCPTCGGPMKPEDLTPKITALTARIDGVQKNVRSLEEQVNTWQEQLTNLGTPEDKTAEVQRLRDSITKNKQIIDLRTKMMQRITEEEARLKVAAQLENRIEDARKALVKEQEAQNPYIDQLIDEQTAMNGVQAELDKVLAEITSYKDEQGYSAYWVDGLSNNKLKSYIMDSITPFINERANYYSQFLTGGTQIHISTLTKLKSGEYRDKFSVIIEDEQGASYYGLSGGERKRVDICILLALQDLVASRARMPLNLLIMDEISENLDDVGVERMLELLHNISSSKGSCLYITHDEGMKPLFPNSVTVVKKNKISQIV